MLAGFQHGGESWPKTAPPQAHFAERRHSCRLCALEHPKPVPDRHSGLWGAPAFVPALRPRTRKAGPRPALRPLGSAGICAGVVASSDGLADKNVGAPAGVVAAGLCACRRAVASSPAAGGPGLCPALGMSDAGAGRLEARPLRQTKMSAATKPLRPVFLLAARRRPNPPARTPALRLRWSKIATFPAIGHFNGKDRYLSLKLET